MDYRIVMVPSSESGCPVGYFDRWHAIVLLDDRRIGYGQGFTQRRAAKRAKRLADRQQQRMARSQALSASTVSNGAPLEMAPEDHPATS